MYNDMSLIIKVKDGQPFEHPMFLGNFQQAYPEIDINNLPPEFAWFERVQPPALGIYEKNQTATYQKGEDNIYRDVWHCIAMSSEEIKQKQDQVKELWNNNPNTPKSWIFDETICEFIPPIPHPSDGKLYIWEEALQEWKLVDSI